MFTSLYLTNVLPASITCAARKVMVMVGPSLKMRWTAIPMATTAARMGMIHTTEIRARRLGTTVASGMSGCSRSSAMASWPSASGIPDQARVEGLRGDHRQHDDGREEEHPRPGFYRHQRLELHEGDGERVDEHVQHRPAADELDEAEQAGPLAALQEGPALDRDQQIAEGDELSDGHHHARDEHDECEGPRARGIQEYHPAHDRVGIRGPQRIGGEDGK